MLFCECHLAMLTQQGYNVMITSYFRYFRICEYFSRDNARKIGFVLNVENIYQIFEESYIVRVENLQIRISIKSKATITIKTAKTMTAPVVFDTGLL